MQRCHFYFSISNLTLKQISESLAQTAGVAQCLKEKAQTPAVPAQTDNLIHPSVGFLEPTMAQRMSFYSQDETPTRASSSPNAWDEYLKYSCIHRRCS